MFLTNTKADIKTFFELKWVEDEKMKNPQIFFGSFFCGLLDNFEQMNRI